MKIELTKEEALVLSDWLYRNSEKAAYFDDIAEQYVFWNIECQLKKELVELCYPNYSDMIAQARENVKNNY